MRRSNEESMPSSRHLVDPLLDRILEALPVLAVTSESLPGIRAAVAERYAKVGDEPDPAVTTATLYVPGPAGPVRVLAYRPAVADAPLPVILHMHGGGFVMGFPELADAEHRRLVKELGVAIYSVDYRLAPEAVYPGQLDDGYAVLGWLHENAADLGLDPARIGLKGESAGGCLAAALALAARDRGGPPVAFQILTFPALDDRTGSTAEPHPYCGEFVWTGAFNRFGWSSLLGSEPGGARTPPHAAPARAQNLEHLPPAYIAVGALDLYLDEDLEYARRLVHAGVPVELHVYPGAIHGFSHVPGSWIERNSERDLADAIGRFVVTRA